MVIARMSIWHFKKGKREDAFSELDLILNTSKRNAKGFRGYISLLSHEDSNASTIITLWQDKESLESSEKGVFAGAFKKVQGSLESPPRMKNFIVFSTELLQRPE